MKQLDLHGYSYFDAEEKVENFVLFYSRELPVRIITGKSDKMRRIVRSVLERHNFHYNIPIHNTGEIIVTK